MNGEIKTVEGDKFLLHSSLKTDKINVRPMKRVVPEQVSRLLERIFFAYERLQIFSHPEELKISSPKNYVK